MNSRKILFIKLFICYLKIRMSLVKIFEIYFFAIISVRDLVGYALNDKWQKDLTDMWQRKNILLKNSATQFMTTVSAASIELRNRLPEKLTAYSEQLNKLVQSLVSKEVLMKLEGTVRLILSEKLKCFDIATNLSLI